MARSSRRSGGSAPAGNTEAYQKHYGRGSGYAESHYHGHPPPPPPHQHGSYPPYHGAPPPPQHGYGHYYYPPHPEVPSPSARGSRGAKHHSMAPPLVTPKSHDSETLPPAMPHAPMAKLPSKAAGKKSPKGRKGKKQSNYKPTPSIKRDAPDMEPEIAVDPMRQDFHFYAADRCDEVRGECEARLRSSGDVPKEKELYLLTTLLNARLVKDWEMAPESTRTAYLKREEADRKRFLSEEEVASRHCATLTARRRSPKQSVIPPGGVGSVGSFGLGADVAVPALPSMEEAQAGKRRGSELDGEMEGPMAKRARVAV
ncbi:hypothetical protein ACHAXT_004619 [Thalassiosira profunda]